MNELQLAEVTVALILLVQLITTPITFKQVNHNAEAELEAGRIAAKVTSGTPVETGEPFCSELSQTGVKQEKCAGFSNSISETGFVFNGFQFEPRVVSVWYNDS